MTVAKLVPVLEAATAGGYGVLAVNIVNGLTLRAVVDAAEELRAPVIVQTSVKTVLSQGIPETMSMYRHAAERATVPVVLHLDHCTDRNVLLDCLKAGWGSVLFDCSGRTLEEATEQTKQVVREARSFGADVEGEIEGITGVEDGVGSDDKSELYPLDDAVRFIRETGIDCFAPANCPRPDRQVDGCPSRHGAGLQNRCANRPPAGGSRPRAWPRLKPPSCGAWRDRDRDAGV
jgi:fructose/tagatose bisphosphate aldolase